MSDPIDQNNPPSTPPPTLPDPQALVDAALSPTPATTTVTAEPVTPPAPPTTITEPSMPTVPPMPEPVAPVTPPTAPEPTPAPPAANVAMGDDTPLAFVTPPPSSSAPSTEPKPPVDGAVPLPPVSPAPNESVVPKKKKGLKTIGLIVGFFAMLGVVGFASYKYFGETGTIAYITKFIRVGDQVVKNPDWIKLESGQSVEDPNGGGVVTADQNKDLRDKDLGIGDYAPDPKIEAANNQGACSAVGGQWCDYGFCMKNDGSQGSCRSRAIELGYEVTTGAHTVSCDGKEVKKCLCGGNQPFCFDKTGYCGDEGGISNQTRLYGLCAITPSPLFTTSSAGCDPEKDGCLVLAVPGNDGSNDGVADWFNDIKNRGALKGSYYCAGMTSNTSGGCSDEGLPPNMKCFCGTIQVDTGTGFESRTMKCGCDKTPKESNPPSITVNPTMACTGLTQAPAAPKVGDKVTFTCTGTITPTTAGTLSYKFRYSINNATPSAMVNKTATTTELSVAACGEYKVECQTCATIAGVLKCDPNWVGATQ